MKIKVFLIKIIDFFKNSIWYTISFICLLFIYLIASSVKSIGSFLPKKIRTKVEPFFKRIYLVILKFNHGKDDKRTISKINIIEIAVRNMSFKKSRSIITVGGMAVGICATVFLVSLGYGVQELIISRVARLDEIKQINVSPQANSSLKIDDKVLARLSGIDKIEKVLPVIAVAGKVDYQNSSTDMVVYGVTTDYLEQSAIKPTTGKIFESYELVNENNNNKGGNYITQEKELEKRLVDVNFSIDEGVWLRVRKEATTESEILGYTKAEKVSQKGQETVGGDYIHNGGNKNKWFFASVLLWEKESCDLEDDDCEKGLYKEILTEDNTQLKSQGYFAEIGVEIYLENNENREETKVLAASVDRSGGDTLEGEIDWIELDPGLVNAVKPLVKKRVVSETGEYEAVVNHKMLEVLNIAKDEAIGKKFNTIFAVTGDLIGEREDKIESESTEYTIIGITLDSDNPTFYIPFIELRSLGVVNYSQVKIIARDNESVEEIRKKIEAMGYITSSVVDTVNQINSFFGVARIILALLGMVALSVAALGMFNTLTVSLLERTREVGLMKALGMRSSEVRELFLTESMIMGFFGGVLGIFLGFIAGKVFSFVLSIFTIYKGDGFIDVTHIPFVFILFILFLSLVVGIGTGIYPARRATKISALNALRYE